MTETGPRLTLMLSGKHLVMHAPLGTSHQLTYLIKLGELFEDPVPALVLGQVRHGPTEA